MRVALHVITLTAAAHNTDEIVRAAPSGTQRLRKDSRGGRRDAAVQRTGSSPAAPPPQVAALSFQSFYE